MTIGAILGAILSFLGSLPKIIDFLSGAINYFIEWYHGYQQKKASRELADAIAKATDDKLKDTRDLEKQFNPDRTYPKHPPTTGS